jgi:hypothetical protein
VGGISWMRGLGPCDGVGGARWGCESGVGGAV